LTARIYEGNDPGNTEFFNPRRRFMMKRMLILGALLLVPAVASAQYPRQNVVWQTPRYNYGNYGYRGSYGRDNTFDRVYFAGQRFGGYGYGNTYQYNNYNYGYQQFNYYGYGR
jgi:hypothetical protein